MAGKQKKLVWFYAVMSGLLVLLFLLNIRYGSVKIPLKSVFQSVLGFDLEKESWRFIIREFRLPKAITAIIAGAGLSLSGLLMQTLFRNPLAGPFVLGISNGSSLGVALLVFSGGSLGFLAGLGNWGTILAGMFGSFAVLLLVMSVSIRVRDNVSLLIVGLMVGSATGAFISILQYFSNPESIQSFLIWTFGSLSGNSWVQIQILTGIFIAGTLISFITVKQLNALLLGEDYARSLGVSIRKSRFFIITATCILAGGITAFCGPIAFVGLAVPNIARAVLKTSNHFILVPSTLLIGACLMLTCNLIAQLPGKDITLPINAVTALIGAPIVIWVVIRSRNMSTAI